MIDTVSISRQLRESGLTLEQSEGIAMQMAEIIQSNLATNDNLKLVEFNQQKQLEETKAKLQKEIQQTKAELQKEIQQIKAELQKEIQQTKAELQKEIQQTKAELQKEIQQTRAELQKEIHRINSSTVLKITGIIIAQTALLFTLIKFFG